MSQGQDQDHFIEKNPFFRKSFAIVPLVNLLSTNTINEH